MTGVPGRPRKLPFQGAAKLRRQVSVWDALGIHEFAAAKDCIVEAARTAQIILCEITIFKATLEEPCSRKVRSSKNNPSEATFNKYCLQGVSPVEVTVFYIAEYHRRR
jgi:hypothetical protein